MVTSFIVYYLEFRVIAASLIVGGNLWLHCMHALVVSLSCTKVYVIGGCHEMEQWEKGVLGKIVW